jgi:hypothetical protein
MGRIRYLFFGERGNEMTNIIANMSKIMESIGKDINKINEIIGLPENSKLYPIETQILHDQSKEIIFDNQKVTCSVCKEKILLRQAYRCFYCSLLFCEICGKNHFSGKGK